MTSIRTTLFALAFPIVLADAGPRCGSSNNNRPVPPPTAPAGDSDAAAPSTPAAPDASH